MNQQKIFPGLGEYKTIKGFGLRAELRIKGPISHCLKFQLRSYDPIHQIVKYTAAACWDGANGY